MSSRQWGRCVWSSKCRSGLKIYVELVSKLLVLKGRRLDEVIKGKDRALRTPEVLQVLGIGERRRNGQRKREILEILVLYKRSGKKISRRKELKILHINVK